MLCLAYGSHCCRIEDVWTQQHSKQCTDSAAQHCGSADAVTLDVPQHKAALLAFVRIMTTAVAASRVVPPKLSTAVTAAVGTECIAPLCCAGEHGRIHITEAEDSSDSKSKKSPLSKLTPGETVKAVVIGSAPLRQVRALARALNPPYVCHSRSQDPVFVSVCIMSAPLLRHIIKVDFIIYLYIGLTLSGGKGLQTVILTEL